MTCAISRLYSEYVAIPFLVHTVRFFGTLSKMLSVSEPMSETGAWQLVTARFVVLLRAGFFEVLTYAIGECRF